MEEIGGDPGASAFSGGLLAQIEALELVVAKVQERLPELKSLTFGQTLTARGLLLALLAVALLWLLPWFVDKALRRVNLLRPNFRGERIPVCFGLVISLFALLMYGSVGALRAAPWSELRPWMALVCGFSALGWMDDVWGNRRYTGLRGHLRAALQERTLTTGLVKAVGGVLLALWLGFQINPHAPMLALLAAALIALSANAVNLLDLRPGRAGAVFLLCAVPLLVWSWRTGTWSAGFPPLLCVVLPALAVWERDARGLVMLGDTGSNVLGACLGFAFVQSVRSPVLLGAVVGLLVAFHLFAERASLTSLLERPSFLRSLDRLTGVRS